MRFIRGIAAAVTKLSAWFGYAALLFMTAIIVMDVAGRNFFSGSVATATEFSGYALVGLIFLGLAEADRAGRHIRIEILLNLLPEGLRKGVERILLIIAALGFAFVAWLSAKAPLIDYQIGTISITGSNMPLWIPEAFIPIGFAALSLRLIARLITDLPGDQSMSAGGL